MQETNNPSPARPTRRRIGIAMVIAVVTAVALLAIRHDGDEPAGAAPPTTAATDIPTPTTTPPGSTRPPTSVAQPMSASPPAAPTAPAPEPEPEPLMADGRHPVFLTDVDVDGATVEFDLLQYLTGAEQEAYEAAHPTDYGGCGCDDDGGNPLHNDNPRLRRLPVAPDMRVFVQGSASGACDGPHTTTFAALPDHFSDGDHDYEPDTGHLGYNAFWLTVDHDTVIDIEELSCAG